MKGLLSCLFGYKGVEEIKCGSKVMFSESEEYPGGST